MLYETLFDDEEQIHNLIRQQKLALEESFSGGGHQAALGRASAYVSPVGCVNEFLSGYEYFRWLKDLEENLEERYGDLRETLEDLLHLLVDRERLVLSYTGTYSESFLTDLLWCFPAVGIKPTPTFSVPTFGALREGIRIPSQVSYAVRLTADPAPLHGSFLVARGILSFEYLWNEIRVKGGAYGAGFLARRGGTLAYYSYRDPSASRSLDVYRGAGDYLRAFVRDHAQIPVKFIIGAVSAQDPLRSPRQMGIQADANYLTGFTYEDECRLRREMLETTTADLLTIADRLDRMSEEDAVCVVGASEKLEECLKNGKISAIIDL